MFHAGHGEMRSGGAAIDALSNDRLQRHVRHPVRDPCGCFRRSPGTMTDAVGAKVAPAASCYEVAHASTAYTEGLHALANVWVAAS